jgi:hypothetical protein
MFKDIYSYFSFRTHNLSASLELPCTIVARLFFLYLKIDVLLRVAIADSIGPLSLRFYSSHSDAIR